MDRKELETIVTNFPNMKMLVENSKITLNDYYKNINRKIDLNISPFQSVLVDAILQYLKNIDLIDCEKELKHSLSTIKLVSTAEHHASISHPETLNLVLNQLLCAQSKNIICLSCSTTKLDNELFPRGIFINETKVPFFSNKYTKYFVSNVGKIKEKYFFENLEHYLVNSQLSLEEVLGIRNFMEFFFKSAQPLETFSEQLTLLNYNLFKSIFKNIAPQVNYFMIPAEEIVVRILIEERSNTRKSWLYKLIFSENRKSLYRILNGIRICWNTTEMKGTFLFWDISSDRPRALFLNNNRLVSKDKKVNFLFDEATIFRKLEKRKIIPASNLVFLYLFAVFHLNLLGGILQVNYLEDLKKALLSNYEELQIENIFQIKNLPTNLYVNFQQNEISSGGLLLVNKPITSTMYEEYKQYNFLNQMEECLEFLRNLL